jgi:hypothetical protein
VVCNFVVSCEHFSKIYILSYTMVICSLWVSIVNDNEIRQFVFKNSVRRGFLSLGSKRTVFDWRKGG